MKRFSNFILKKINFYGLERFFILTLYPFQFFLLYLHNLCKNALAFYSEAGFLARDY